MRRQSRFAKARTRILLTGLRVQKALLEDAIRAMECVDRIRARRAQAIPADTAAKKRGVNS